jgi:hypothetical protein
MLWVHESTIGICRFVFTLQLTAFIICSILRIMYILTRDHLGAKQPELIAPQYYVVDNTRNGST